MNRLALGTAQFGMDYGINNQRGIIPEKEVFEILDLAAASGINLLDTAHDYGRSEEVIGKYRQNNDHRFNIVTKLVNEDKVVLGKMMLESFDRLGGRPLYGCVIHEFAVYRDNPHIYDVLKQAKASGRVQKVGFSIYYPTELDSLLDQDIHFDLLQIPYNVFDQRFAPYFSRLRERGIELHVRSVFLQGLVFRAPDKLPAKLARFAGKLAGLGKIAREQNVPVAALCLNFALLEQGIDQVVVGVDSLDNLKQNLASQAAQEKVNGLMPALKALREDNEEFILPFKWEAN